MGILKQSLVACFTLGATVLPSQAQPLPSADTVRAMVKLGLAGGHLQRERGGRFTFPGWRFKPDQLVLERDGKPEPAAERRVPPAP